MIDRSFDVPELKILIDAIQAASFITPKKSAELIHKIANLGGSHRAEILKSNLVNFNTNKHTNEAIYYNVQSLEEGIARKKQVSFFYFNLNENVNAFIARTKSVQSSIPSPWSSMTTITIWSVTTTSTTTCPITE